MLHGLVLVLIGLVSCACASRPPSSPRAGRIETAKGDATTATGVLPPAEIQRVVRSNYQKFRMCFEASLARDPSMSGTVRVRFVIDREGKVSDIQDGGSHVPDAVLLQCVLHAFKTIEFPPPVGGTVTVLYPITLVPG